MTKRRVVLAVAALGLCLAGAAPSQASTITPESRLVTERHHL